MKCSVSRWSPVVVLAVVLAACARKAETQDGAKPAAVELVPQAERSQHFEAVNSHLELGGTLYGYVDVDGDALALAGSVQGIVKQIAIAQPRASMYAKQDFKELFSDLGLDDVKAIGLSSVRQSSGIFRNRAFLYTPAGRHGIFAVFGGKPAPFVGASLAPSDADFYSEHEFNVAALYDTVKSVIAKVNGPEAASGFETQLKNVGAKAMFSLLDLIEDLNGRAVIIIRFDPEKNVPLPSPKPINIPAFSVLVRIDGIGPAIEGALAARSADLEASQEGTLHLYTSKAAPPIEGLKYVLAVDGKAFFAATSGAFLHECLQRKEGLDKNPAFTAGLAALGPEGNGLTWISPRFVSRLRSLGDINPQAGPDVKRVLDGLLLNVPAFSEPLLSVRTNLPDGILIRSNWNRSLKADLAMFTIYNPVTVGLIAAMAIPAFQKVRTNSQAMSVMNNLRMLNAASEQYYLQHGANPTYDDLVGPDKAIKALAPVAGEDYRSLIFLKGQRLSVRLDDGRTIAYPNHAYHPSASPARRQNIAPRAENVPLSDPIVENLRLLSEAADRYYAAHDTTTTTFDQLVGPGKSIEAIKPVGDENYHSLLFKQGHPLHLFLRDGRVVVYPQPRHY